MQDYEKKNKKDQNKKIEQREKITFRFRKILKLN
jgi:hypothetical protein